MKLTRRSAFRPDSGSVLVLSMLMLLALGGLTATLAMLNLRLHKEHERAREDLRAFCVAEAGLNEAYAVLQEKSVAGVRALAYPCAASSGSYEVELLDGRDSHEIDLDRIRLRSKGEAGRGPAGAQLMVDHVPTGSFRFALFGADGVKLNSNVMIDSYDPADGDYPDKVDFVNDYGNVGSYKKISIDSNVEIHGDALVAEDGVFDDDSPGVLVSGDLKAGKLDVTMPPIAIPLFPTKGALTVLTKTTLPAGNYHYSSLSVSKGILNIQGPATLVLDSFAMLSNTMLQIDATNGPVKLFATGNVKLASNSKIHTNTSSARDFEVSITSNNITGGKIVELNSNSDFMGTIYAPHAKLTLPSNFKVFGAVKAASIEMASNGQVHFDEGLLYDPTLPDIFQIVSWRRLSQDEIGSIEVGPLP